MKEDLHHYLRVGIIHFMAFPEIMSGEGPVLDTIRQIAADEYFDAIEITWIKSTDIRAKAKKLLETAGLDIAYGAQPRLLTTGQNINDLDETARQLAVANLKEGIDEAYEMGAVGYAFLSGKYVEDKKEQAYQALLKSTRELCEYAKSKGDMPIIHEIFDSDIDKCSLVGPVSLARRYAEDICKDYDNFGLMADLSHLPLLGETPEEALMPIKDYLLHIHIGNCVAADPSLPCYGDLHPRFGFPGSEISVSELTNFLRVLFEIGFLHDGKRPIISFEVKPFGDEESEMVIANAKRTLNHAWTLL